MLEEMISHVREGDSLGRTEHFFGSWPKVFLSPSVSSIDLPLFFMPWRAADI